jgi:hypothetical protein
VISFRNHVVTLLAVFLALAAGIALGGGPLSEVGRSPLTAATSDKHADTADAVAFGDTFAQASAARLYADGLAGHPVALLTLPGADEKTVAGLTAQVEKAGGAVTATYAAESALVDPGEKALVDTLGSQLMTQIEGDIADQAAPTYDRMGQIIGTAIATTTAAPAASTDAAAAIRQALAGAELAVSPEGSPQRSPLVLVVLGEDTDDDVLAGLTAGLAAKALGVVVAGDTASGADGDLAALRSSALAGDVATVDGAERALGQTTATLALIRALGTKGGAFGASGSDGAVPLG